LDILSYKIDIDNIKTTYLMGYMKNAYRILIGKPAGKRPLGRPKRR
jgi:hypothetical protein